jgi:hypothetical protein
VTEAIPKEALDEVFPRPAIREVVFEIRFAPRLRVNVDLWRIQDLVLDAYPTVGTESLLQPGSSISAVAEFSSCTPSAPPSTYTFKLIGQVG